MTTVLTTLCLLAGFAFASIHAQDAVCSSEYEQTAGEQAFWMTTSSRSLGNGMMRATWSFVTVPGKTTDVGYFKVAVGNCVDADPTAVSWGPQGNSQSANTLMINDVMYFQFNFGIAPGAMGVDYWIDFPSGSVSAVPFQIQTSNGAIFVGSICGISCTTNAVVVPDSSPPSLLLFPPPPPPPPPPSEDVFTPSPAPSLPALLPAQSNCNPHFAFPAGFKMFFIDTAVTTSPSAGTTTVTYIITRGLLEEYNQDPFQLDQFAVQIDSSLNNIEWGPKAPGRSVDNVSSNGVKFIQFMWGFENPWDTVVTYTLTFPASAKIVPRSVLIHTPGGSAAEGVICGLAKSSGNRKLLR
eukprot:jgi/Chlat1/4705/Chrsp30S04757